MNQHMYRIDETDVNGTGGESAYVYVTFPRVLTTEEEEKLSTVLRDVKKNNDWSDIEELVFQALEQFDEETGIYGEICRSPLEGVIEF